ncbi:Chitin binding domain containng protein [Biomphalaria glabrata]|uniref:Chitin-binding type-2 domain-containing protein n=1 Tax=Biomphalaria glabrata TaxID=6526 RepID=A0A2C9LEA3_BIOGL|nr:Chitin binding domain containng protein [Biomphalaria glabrata]
MISSIFGILALSLVVSSYGSLGSQCINASDGFLVEVGCWGYFFCQNGQVARHVCQNGTYLDKDSLTCINTSITNTTRCGYPVDCSVLSDGYYPDVETGCSSFYVCLNHVYMGRQYCPGALVFDPDLKICNWPSQVSPPCGTGV